MLSLAALFVATFLVAGVLSAVALLGAAPAGVPLSGVLHAVVGLVAVSMPAVVARTVSVGLVIVLTRVI